MKQTYSADDCRLLTRTAQRLAGLQVMLAQVAAEQAFMLDSACERLGLPPAQISEDGKYLALGSNVWLTTFGEFVVGADPVSGRRVHGFSVVGLPKPEAQAQAAAQPKGDTAWSGEGGKVGIFTARGGRQ